MNDREFLFEYRFDGAVYGQSVTAPDVETARRKINAMGLAIYKGEVAAKVSLPFDISRLSERQLHALKHPDSLWGRMSTRLRIATVAGISVILLAAFFAAT